VRCSSLSCRSWWQCIGKAAPSTTGMSLRFFAKKAPAKSVPNEDRIWVTAEVVSFLRDVAMWNDLTTRGTYGRAQRLKVQFTPHAVDPALILDRRLTFQQSDRPMYHRFVALQCATNVSSLPTGRLSNLRCRRIANPSTLQCLPVKSLCVANLQLETLLVSSRQRLPIVR